MTYKCDYCGYDFEINYENVRKVINSIREEKITCNLFGCEHCRKELKEMLNNIEKKELVK